jgi:hypothetical protein
MPEAFGQPVTFAADMVGNEPADAMERDDRSDMRGVTIAVVRRLREVDDRPDVAGEDPRFREALPAEGPARLGVIRSVDTTVLCIRVERNASRIAAFIV